MKKIDLWFVYDENGEDFNLFGTKEDAEEHLSYITDLRRRENEDIDEDFDTLIYMGKVEKTVVTAPGLYLEEDDK